MPAPPAYDLMILVDTAEAPEEARARVVEDVKKQIAAGEGELKGDADWGVRRLAYEIDHRTEAYYHLFQLEASATLLNQLEHSLSIDDQVLRHRVIKLPKGAPERTPRPEPSTPRQAEPSAEQGLDESRPAEPEPRAAEAEASPAEPQTSPAEAEASPAQAEASPTEAETGPAEAQPSPQPAEQAPS